MQFSDIFMQRNATARDNNKVGLSNKLVEQAHIY
jgi:hypothetical protein